MYKAPSKTLVWCSWCLAILLLISAGITYRIIASHLGLIVDTPVRLPIPLSDIPMRLQDWEGRDVSLPSNVQRIAKNDDFLNRLYTNKLSGQWINLYLAYTARPRTMLGHRPQVCYVANGWAHDNTQQSEFISKAGRKIPCLIHWFHTPAPSYEERVILNFYIVNGKITNDESVFSGVGWRTPNISGDPARYVAQVQISSSLENSIRTAANGMIELLLDFFPDENGEVRAAKSQNSINGIIRESKTLPVQIGIR